MHLYDMSYSACSVLLLCTQLCMPRVSSACITAERGAIAPPPPYYLTSRELLPEFKKELDILNVHVCFCLLRQRGSSSHRSCKRASLSRAGCDGVNFRTSANSEALLSAASPPSALSVFKAVVLNQGVGGKPGFTR